MSKKRLLSGMQPTGGGRLHLGNLEGALRPWVQRQDEYEMFCMIADWHALTTISDGNYDLAAASRQTTLDYHRRGRVDFASDEDGSQPVRIEIE